MPLPGTLQDWNRRRFGPDSADDSYDHYLRRHPWFLTKYRPYIMNARLRRLQADHQQVLRLFKDHAHIRLLKTEGMPPEKYTFTFNVQGIAPAGPDDVAPVGQHQAEVFLPLDYLRRPPFCRLITPVFHPNIDPQKICIGDHWSAGQSLSQMVVHIGQMICFQSYKLKSPLNAKAAVWAEANISSLPLLSADLSVGL